MVRGDLENSDLSWLKSMMKNELDLRPPSLARTNQTSKVIRDEQGNPIAHVAITNRWQGSEINSLVVDPAHRGNGLSHQLLSRAMDGRLFCYTRDERLKSALNKAGYKRAKFPGVAASANLLLTRSAIFAWMILTLDFKRIFHQIKHLPSYKLYMKINSD
jgi:GNAT superfamily N-acetyltransferase